MDYAHITLAADYLRTRLAGAAAPRIGVVLGSGLGALADSVERATKISYASIPHFHQTSVLGHAGALVAGTLNGTAVALLQGRIHLYEGHSPDTVVLPVRVLARLGVKALILTNAAGGVNPAYEPGDFMVIRDHLNLQGANPLLGPNDDRIGPRFPDMSAAYDPQLSDIICACAAQERVRLHNGVYAGMLGPAYETPAEVRMLRTLGADAVGMSTVMETLAARHAGVRVCGISLITNKAAGLGAGALSHEEVKAAADEAGERFVRLMQRVIAAIAAAGVL